MRFKPVEGLKGVQYFKPQGVLADGMTFTTQELAAKEPRCSAQSNMMPLGLLVRSKEALPENGGVIAEIGGYLYQYCGTDAALLPTTEEVRCYGRDSTSSDTVSDCY
ncbi:MAG TPA: hypothetical protein VFO38_02925 [Candidatus Saccharimonadales bacterium]|nr:hypothetical protein [Candidatus Saccharimonadales bacterium]